MVEVVVATGEEELVVATEVVLQDTPEVTAGEAAVMGVVPVSEAVDTAVQGTPRENQGRFQVLEVEDTAVEAFSVVAVAVAQVLVVLVSAMH